MGDVKLVVYERNEDTKDTTLLVLLLMVLGKEEIPNRCAVIVRIVTVFRFVRATRVADDADDENDWFKVRKYSLEKGKNRQRDRILKEEKNGGRRNESKAFHFSSPRSFPPSKSYLSVYFYPSPMNTF